MEEEEIEKKYDERKFLRRAYENQNEVNVEEVRQKCSSFYEDILRYSPSDPDLEAILFFETTFDPHKFFSYQDFDYCWPLMINCVHFSCRPTPQWEEHHLSRTIQTYLLRKDVTDIETVKKFYGLTNRKEFYDNITEEVMRSGRIQVLSDIEYLSLNYIPPVFLVRGTHEGILRYLELAPNPYEVQVEICQKPFSSKVSFLEESYC